MVGALPPHPRRLPRLERRLRRAATSLDGGIDNARAGSFRDAYFFSVQTMATIGYGRMVPVSTFSNIVVTLEALFGLVTLALATGLMFAKFSRPRARVLFSRYAVVGMRDGVRSLMVRLANERATGLVEATLTPGRAARREDARGRADPALSHAPAHPRIERGLRALVDRGPPDRRVEPPLRRDAGVDEEERSAARGGARRHRGGQRPDGPRPPRVDGGPHPLRSPLPRHPRRGSPRAAAPSTTRTSTTSSGSLRSSSSRRPRVEIDEHEPLLRRRRRPRADRAMG